MADDLFSAAVEERLRGRAPLAARLRPRSLDEVVGQDELLAPGKPLRVLIESDRLASVVLWGPPGTGKTTIARLVAGATRKAFEPLSAVTAGVKDVREVVERARARLGERAQGTILFLDEVHRFNRTQQDALLPHVEEGLLVLVSATTENPFFSLTGPLLSRSTLFRLEALDSRALRTLLERALTDRERGLGDDGLAIAPDALEHLADRAEGDARHALTSLEVAAALAAEAGHETITLDDAEAALSLRAIRYGADEHYDVLSAFIKSIRGSDPDSGLYWLARMLEAGEDPRLIARRLVILASEDVGLADPQSLLVADAAARAVEFVGLPEAQLNLAHAVLHLALGAEVQLGDHCARRGPHRRARRAGREGPRAPPRRSLPWRREARPRRGIPVSARPAVGLGRPGVPSGRGRRTALLPAQRARRRRRPARRQHPVRRDRGSDRRPGRRTMTARQR